MMSTLPYLTIEMGECIRKTLNEKKQYETATYPRPAIIEKYSEKMFFVDRRFANNFS